MIILVVLLLLRNTAKIRPEWAENTEEIRMDQTMETLARLILTRPEKEAKKLLAKLFDGEYEVIKSGQMSAERTNNFRKFLNRAIQKEIRMIFNPDFTKAETQHRENNRRFFELLEQGKMVDFVEAVCDPYNGFIGNDEDDHTFFDLLQVTDPRRPRGMDIISIPVPVFSELINSPDEMKADGETWESRRKVKAFFESKGIEIGFIKKRAGFNEWGFYNAFWQNHRFCIVYAGNHPTLRFDTLRWFFLIDFVSQEYWEIKISKSDEALTIEEEDWLCRDLDCLDVKDEITKDQIFDVFAAIYGRDRRFW